nr:LysR substrate-binding domain-containing protein [Pseudonocardia sp. MH-G8]
MRHLRYFVAVAESRSFTEAARQLHMAQPPLSQQLARMEKSLGLRLLDRNVRPLALTPEGQVLYAEAKALLEHADLAFERVDAVREGRTGLPTLATLPSSLYLLLPRLLGGYRAAFPDVEVRLEVMPTVHQLESLRKGHVDAAMIRTRRPSTSAVTGSTLLETNRFVAAVSASHAVGARNQIDLAELADERFLALQRVNGVEYDDLFVGLCNEAGFSPKIVRRVEDVHSMLGMVACGLGVALVLDLYREHHLPSVRYVELVDAQPVQLGSYLVWPEPVSNPILREFIAFTRSHGAEPS